MPLFDVKEHVGFSEKFAPRILHADERMKLVLVCLDAGQRIPPHAEDNQGVFTVLEGSGIMTTDDGELPITAGSVVVVRHGGTRGIRAENGRLVVLANAILDHAR